jgi:hypothetical protein
MNPSDMIHAVLVFTALFWCIVQLLFDTIKQTDTVEPRRRIYCEYYDGTTTLERRIEILGHVYHGRYERRAVDGTMVISCVLVRDRLHGLLVEHGHSVWFGTTDETRGEEITKEEHDEEMRKYERSLEHRPEYVAWRRVARILKICRDVERLIGRQIFDESDVEYAYYLKWLAENER